MRRKTHTPPVIDTGLGTIAGHRMGKTSVDYHVVAISGESSITPEQEQDYMQRIAAGDRDAFGYIVSIHMRGIHRFAFSILGDSARAEDMTQETFLRLWTRSAQWNPSGRLKSWLFRIAHNLCLDELRSRKNTAPIDDVIINIPDTTPGTAAKYEGLQLSGIVNTALFALPERQRTALMLVHYDGYSQTESAAIMNLSVDAVESLLARGRKKLKDLLLEQKNTLLEG